MRVELKKLQIVARMSQETICFVADVYVDGKKVGTAENEGHGGNTSVRIDRSVSASVDAHARSVLPEDMKQYEHLNPTEWLIDDIVSKHLDAKETARAARKAAKIDEQYKASCPARGTRAARFQITKPGAVETRWVEFRGEDSAARAAAEKKHGQIQNWTVVA